MLWHIWVGTGPPISTHLIILYKCYLTCPYYIYFYFILNNSSYQLSIFIITDHLSIFNHNKCSLSSSESESSYLQHGTWHGPAQPKQHQVETKYVCEIAPAKQKFIQQHILPAVEEVGIAICRLVGSVYARFSRTKKRCACSKTSQNLTKTKSACASCTRRLAWDLMFVLWFAFLVFPLWRRYRSRAMLMRSWPFSLAVSAASSLAFEMKWNEIRHAFTPSRCQLS